MCHDVLPPCSAHDLCCDSAPALDCRDTRLQDGQPAMHANSGRETLRVAREERRLANVGQSAEEHHDALQSDATARVREGAVFERIDVRLDGRQIDGRLLGRSLRQEHLGVVDPLRARRDLRTAVGRV